MISLHEPKFSKIESDYVKDCVKSGWLTSGNFKNKFAREIIKYTGAKYAALCTNGTNALHIALKVIGLKNDHEVLVPSLTFIASVNSILYNRAKPIFYDCNKFYVLDQKKLIDFFNKETISIKEKKTNKKILVNKKTKKRIFAIVLVHTFGNASNIDKIYKFLINNNVYIVEDAAESLGTKFIKGKFKGKFTGTIGNVGCLSFNGNKIITSGGGGAILTNNKKINSKIHYLINQAKDDALLYKHHEMGYNMSLSNIHAAIGYAQIKKIKKILIQKKRVHETYLKKLKYNNFVQISKTPTYSKNNYWLNILELKKNYNLKLLIKKFQKHGIEIRPLWFPSHKQLYLKKFKSTNMGLFNNIYKKRICLPSSYHLTQIDIDKVCKYIERYCK